MYIGLSGCRGIMIKNTSLSQDNTVYGYYENNQIIIEKGQYDDIKEIRDKHEKEYKRTDKKLDYPFFIILIMMIMVCIFSFWFYSFLIALSILVFCIISYFPMNVIMVACIGSYQDKKIFHQFKRFHGAEHAVVKLMSDQKELNLETIKKESIYDNECGTVYSLEFIILALIICFLIQHILIWGFFKCLMLLLGVIIVLFINIFNPYNPFQYIQKMVVEKPNDKDYILALSVAQSLKKQEEVNYNG